MTESTELTPTPPPNPRPGVSHASLARSYGVGGAYGSTGSATGSAVGRAGVEGALAQAPVAQRARAAGIDAAAVLVPTLAVGIAAYFAIYRPACRSYPFLGGTRLDCSDAGAAGVWSWIMIALTFLLMVALYEVLPVGRSGATWGMHQCGVAVVDDATGEAIGWRRAALRSLLRWTVSLELVGMGYWWALVDDRGLTWHDLIGRTLVVPAEAVEGAAARGIEEAGG